MKNLISFFALGLSICATEPLFGQVPAALETVPPEMKSEAPILPYRKTVAERMCYTAYAEANKYVVEPDVIFMGDSITDLWYGADRDFFKDNGFIGRGIGGQTTIGILSRFHQDVIDLNPKIVVILAGINDIAGNDGEMSLENTIGNLAAMCDMAKAHGIIPLLCSLTPCSRFFWAPEENPAPEVKKANEMIKAYAEESGVQYVDYYSEMVDDKGGMRPGYSEDGCHPTAKGYQVMESVIMKYISKLI